MRILHLPVGIFFSVLKPKSNGKFQEVITGLSAYAANKSILDMHIKISVSLRLHFLFHLSSESHL